MLDQMKPYHTSGQPFTLTFDREMQFMMNTVIQMGMVAKMR